MFHTNGQSELLDFMQKPKTTTRYWRKIAPGMYFSLNQMIVKHYFLSEGVDFLP